MTNFKTHFNQRDILPQGETYKKPSKTVPDQAMTVQQIMDRFARGLPIHGVKVPVYNGESDLPDLNKLDLSEIQDLKDLAAQNIIDKRNELQTINDEKARQKKLSQQKANPTPPTGTSDGN